MTDPRQRAPFAHVSSSLDLPGYVGTPPLQQSPPRFANGLAPPGINGGPGFFPQPPPPQPSPFTRAANAAAGAFGGLGLVRKGSDQGLDDYARSTSSSSSGNTIADAISRIQQSASALFSGNGSSSSSSDTGIALPSIQTVRFVFLCILWYASSAVSSNTGKVILNNFKFPVTLTIVQFAFVAALCWLGSRRQLNWTSRLRSPTRSILRHTMPMAAFQVGGHIFSSLAISRVPVSTVHTIKVSRAVLFCPHLMLTNQALSPCFTVAAYVFLFGVSYSPATYLSLLPLTLGVMLACSFDISFSNFTGLVCAFGSTIIFVSQNIFFKKVMPSPGSSGSGSADAPRLDKINLLYFSSGMAFLLMLPVWIYTDAPRLLSLWFGTTVSLPGNPSTAVSSAKVVLYFFINGTVHFAQILLAFALLASTSPVTYSIASLIKRIAVICLAIVWFNQPVHPIQAIGISLTALGLYMYNNAKRDVDKGEKRMRQVEAQRDGMLPTTLADQRLLEGDERGGASAFSTPTPAQYAYAETYHPHLHPSYPPHKDAHASPRPLYNPHFDPPTVAKVSARPPPYAVTRKPQQPEPYPYPSPPASTASSPPLPPLSRDDLPTSPVALTAGGA